MRQLLFLISITLCSTFWAQDAFINGKISDKDTGEPLIGATILYTEGKGAITDFNGEFTMTIPMGNYSFNVSYTGFETITLEKKIEKKNNYLEFKLSSISLREVTVVADVARTRETPVAFSNICLLYTSPSPRDRQKSRMPSSA